MLGRDFNLNPDDRYLSIAVTPYHSSEGESQAQDNWIYISSLSSQQNEKSVSRQVACPIQLETHRLISGTWEKQRKQSSRFISLLEREEQIACPFCPVTRSIFWNKTEK